MSQNQESKSADSVLFAHEKQRAEGKSANESSANVFLVPTEGKDLRRLALQIKNRAERMWRNREEMLRNRRLHILANLAHIKEDADEIYKLVSDATWRDEKEGNNNA